MSPDFAPRVSDGGRHWPSSGQPQWAVLSQLCDIRCMGVNTYPQQRHLRCRVFRRTSPDCGWLPSNQRLGEACGGATDGQTGRYGVFTVSKCESFLLRRLGVSTGRWGGNLGFKAREVGKRPKCRVSWGKEKIHRPQALCFSGSQNSASGSQQRHLRCRGFSPDLAGLRLVAQQSEARRGVRGRDRWSNWSLWGLHGV